MKNVVYLVLLLCCFACSKEGELSNEIDFSNVYAIEDDASNAVQHERYLIYKEYNISVYFNDTISRAFVRNDIYGNPVYRYETVDPRWVFFNDSDQRINGTFEYVYTQEEERQLRSLQMIRMFLEETSDALRPTIIFAVDTARVLNGNVMSAPYAYRSAGQDRNPAYRVRLYHEKERNEHSAGCGIGCKSPSASYTYDLFDNGVRYAAAYVRNRSGCQRKHLDWCRNRRRHAYRNHRAALYSSRALHYLPNHRGEGYSKENHTRRRETGFD